MDHHHNVDAKVPTKVRFQEPGSKNTNITDDTKEKLMHEAELNNKELEAEEINEKDEVKENNDEEAKLIGGSPKAENRENTEKEAKEAKETKEVKEAKEATEVEAKEIKENTEENSQSPEAKKPTITP